MLPCKKFDSKILGFLVLDRKENYTFCLAKNFLFKMFNDNLLLMKIKLICLLFLFSTHIYASEIKCQFPSHEYLKISEGVEFAKFDLSFTPYNRDLFLFEEKISRKVTLRVLKVDLTFNRFSFINFDKAISCNPQTERFIKKLIDHSDKKVIAAINASFFDMKNSDVLGLAMDEKVVWWNDLNTLASTSGAVFGIQENLPFMTDKNDFIKTYGAIMTLDTAKNFNFAIQAYPKLVRNNEVIVSKEVLNTHRPRTALTYKSSENQFYLITLDARGENAETGMTLYEFGHMIQSKNCGFNVDLAINLDGGGSTSIAVPSLNIYEQVDHCRGLGNILAVEKRQ